MPPTTEDIDAVTAQGNTPIRAMRIADDIWAAAQRRAEADGTNVTAVVVAYLKRYARAYMDDDPEPPPSRR